MESRGARWIKALANFDLFAQDVAPTFKHRSKAEADTGKLTADARNLSELAPRIPDMGHHYTRL